MHELLRRLCVRQIAENYLRWYWATVSRDGILDAFLDNAGHGVDNQFMTFVVDHLLTKTEKLFSFFFYPETHQLVLLVEHQCWSCLMLLLVEN